MRKRIDEQYITPGYEQKAKSFCDELRIVENKIRDGYFEEKKIHLSNLKPDLSNRKEMQDGVLLHCILYLIDLPEKLDDEKFQEYCWIVWQVIEAVPVTQYAGDQREKSHYWIKVWSDFLNDVQFNHDLVKTHKMKD